ncbi:MAG: hypothetical protein ACI9EX_001154 [Oleispira sp.]|jgi:hypothetical protein
MPAIKKDTDKKIADQKKVSKLEAIATTCPRCSARFLCNAANIQQCQCWGVELGSETFTYLKQQGFSVQQQGCLCRNCLLEIQREVADAVNNSSLT